MRGRQRRREEKGESELQGAVEESEKKIRSAKKSKKEGKEEKAKRYFSIKL